MKTSMLIIVAVLLILTVVLFFNKKPEYKIIGIRDFFCPGMEGFTFKYPEFEGWEVDGMTIFRPHECSISLSMETLKVKGVDLEVSSQILVTKMSASVVPKLTLSNTNSIKYEGDVVNSSSDRAVTEAVNSVRFYYGGY